MRDHIGYMGQKVSLYAGLSLRENVEFYAGLYGLTPEQLEQRWGALRERFSLGETEDEKTEDLPAGIRQRAGLALSTLHQPRVLFLDEPTAGVDVHNRGLFWELIQDEAHAGVTVFVTTHFLEETDYCDWVCFIDAGRVIANDEPEAAATPLLRGLPHRASTLPAEQRARCAEVLGGIGRAARAHADRRADRRPDARSAGARRARRGSAPPAREAQIHIEQAQMTDIFRRVLADERRRGMNWRRLRTLIRREVLATFRDPFTVTILITVPLAALLIFGFVLATDVKGLALGVLDANQHGRQPAPGRRARRQGHLHSAPVRDPRQPRSRPGRRRDQRRDHHSARLRS